MTVRWVLFVVTLVVWVAVWSRFGTATVLGWSSWLPNVVLGVFAGAAAAGASAGLFLFTPPEGSAPLWAVVAGVVVWGFQVLLLRTDPADPVSEDLAVALSPVPTGADPLQWAARARYLFDLRNRVLLSVVVAGPVGAAAGGFVGAVLAVLWALSWGVAVGVRVGFALRFSKFPPGPNGPSSGAAASGPDRLPPAGGPVPPTDRSTEVDESR